MERIEQLEQFFREHFVDVYLSFEFHDFQALSDTLTFHSRRDHDNIKISHAAIASSVDEDLKLLYDKRERLGIGERAATIFLSAMEKTTHLTNIIFGILKYDHIVFKEISTTLNNYYISPVHDGILDCTLFIESLNHLKRQPDPSILQYTLQYGENYLRFVDKLYNYITSNNGHCKRAVATCLNTLLAGKSKEYWKNSFKEYRASEYTNWKEKIKADCSKHPPTPSRDGTMDEAASITLLTSKAYINRGKILEFRELLNLTLVDLKNWH